MNLAFDATLAALLKSPTQRTRVLTEHWVGTEAYCPNCGNVSIDKYPNNSPGADFCCRSCREDYELKSQRDRFGRTVVDGAYSAVMERLAENRNPNLFLLNYERPKLVVLNFIIVPKHFFTAEIVEKRKPLAPSARRAGWTGCKFLLDGIPLAGRIFVVRNSVVEPKSEVLAKWQQTLFLREQKDASAKGWLLSVMRCIEKLGSRTFSLDQVYSFEPDLKTAYPGNRHVKEKIRQQLQVLRDKGYIEFVGRGNYRFADATL